MRHPAVALICAALSPIAFTQQQTGPQTPPVQAKRLAPGKSNAGTPDRNDSFVDHYDFGAQAIALQDAPLLRTGATPANPVPGSSAAPAPTPSGVPAGYRPRTDVQLTQTAEEAVQMSQKWMAEHNEPGVGRDGRVLYSYGAGLPTLVCAPLRVCTVELQAGEKLVGEPHIGDSVRWNLSPATYGNGDSATYVVVLKPQSPGLDTNLLITTNRRAYYLRLLSKPEEYTARVAFAYPEDEEGAHKWREQLARQKEQEHKATQIAELPRDAVETLYFNYRVRAGDSAMRPVRVFDDGKKTYIQMSPEVKDREAPVLVVLGPDGKQEIVNYRVKDGMYIVDRLFDRAQLILGTGKKARKVEINRERKS